MPDQEIIEPTVDHSPYKGGRDSRIKLFCYLAALVSLLFLPIVASFLFAKDGDSYKLIATLLISLALISTLLIFPKSENIDAILTRATRRSGLCSFIATVLFGFFIANLLTAQSIQVAQEQVEIANRETAPALSLKPFSQDGKRGYELTNSKGIASYVSLNVQEKYNFRYNDESYEATLMLLVDTESDSVNLDSNCSRALFELEDASFDRDAAYRIVKEYLKNELGTDVGSSNTREISLSFFDHQNQQFTFSYTEYDGVVKLASTTQGHIYKHSMGTLFMEGRDLEETIHSLLKDLTASY